MLNMVVWVGVVLDFISKEIKIKRKKQIQIGHSIS